MIPVTFPSLHLGYSEEALLRLGQLLSRTSRLVDEVFRGQLPLDHITAASLTNNIVELERIVPEGDGPRRAIIQSFRHRLAGLRYYTESTTLMDTD